MTARVHLPAAWEVGGLGYVTRGFASWNAANRSALWRCQATAEPLRHHGFAAAFAAVPVRSDPRRRQLPSDADRRLVVVNRFGHSPSPLCSPAPVAINNASVYRNTRWSSASRAPVSVRAIQASSSAQNRANSSFTSGCVLPLRADIAARYRSSSPQAPAHANPPQSGQARDSRSSGSSGYGAVLSQAM